MEMPLNERLKIIARRLNVNISEFAKATDTDKATMTRTFAGHTIPRFDLIERVYQAYPHISAEFLLSGKGDALGVQVAANVHQIEIDALRRENTLLNELLSLYRDAKAASPKGENQP